MTPNEIKAIGFTPIESEKQMYFLPDEKYELLRGYGKTEFATKTCDRWEVEDGCIYSSVGLKPRYIGFRHVPDAVPVAAAGFEKKTEIGGVVISDISSLTYGAMADGLANELVLAYDHIDKQAAEIAELSTQNLLLHNKIAGHVGIIESLGKELAALKAERKIKIESGEYTREQILEMLEGNE